MKTTIYIDKETEEIIKLLRNENDIYKVISLSQLVKYALIEKCKVENIRINNKQKQTKRKKELEQKFGSEKDIIELAQFDWVNEE